MAINVVSFRVTNQEMQQFIGGREHGVSLLRLPIVPSHFFDAGHTFLKGENTPK